MNEDDSQKEEELVKLPVYTFSDLELAEKTIKEKLKSVVEYLKTIVKKN